MLPLSPSAVLLPLYGPYAVRLLAGPAGPVRPLAYRPWLYLTPAHLAHQQGPGERLHFFLEDEVANRTLAQLAVYLDAAGEEARSPWRAPFGAVQGTPDLTPDLLRHLVHLAEDVLRARGVRRLTLRAPAFAYEPTLAATLTQALQDQRYAVRLAEINYHLPLAQAFEARLHPSERRRLRKCQQQGLQFEQESALLLPLAHEFIGRCRREKGQEAPMPLEQLQALFREFPRQFLLFSVRAPSGEWAALTVAILVRHDVLYSFYPASPLSYNHLSPAVLLNAGLHAFGQANGLRLLDLGTSTLPTGLNEPLLRFKRHLGGVPSLKLTFEKDIGG